VGYALVGLATAASAGVQGILIYLTLYIFMSIGAFTCVLLMQRNGKYVEDISELAGMAQSRPRLALVLAAFMFSMAGIPPLAGFFGKFYIFLSAIDAGLVYLAVLGVLSSVIAAFYYLKIVKILYLDEPKEAFDANRPLSMQYVLALCAGVTLLYFLMPTSLVELAAEAASVFN
jgi:NADH-quinone oxidoreductase subunit N